MTPYYDDGAVTIYCGDALEVMPRLPHVDVITTSPPYNVGLNYGVAYQDTKENSVFLEWNRDWLQAAFQIANDPSRFYVAVGESMLWWFRMMAETTGWTYGQLLVWCKTNIATPRRISGDWNYMADWILLFRKGKRGRMLSDGHSSTMNWMAYSYPQSNFAEKKVHPAQWPLSLLSHILSRTPGQVVLDPFMGSGTALVAAKKLGRQAIGIDISEEYCEIAANRCRQMVMELET